MDSILSMLNALSSNGLFIAFISAWFTIQMHSIVSAYKEFIKIPNFELSCPENVSSRLNKIGFGCGL